MISQKNTTAAIILLTAFFLPGCNQKTNDNAYNKSLFEYNDNIDARWSSGENRNGVKGESKENQQVYQKQVAATVSLLLGMQFTANHRIGQPLTVLPPTQKEEVGEATSAIISR